MALANEKQQAYQLLDQLDAGQLAAVVHLLQVMTGPLSHSLASAPVEEEEISSETAAALDRARTSLARGEGIPHEDILREFGLDKRLRFCQPRLILLISGATLSLISSAI